MAHKDFSVLLGYEDEMITDKHKGQTNFTTNKIGGKPVSSLYLYIWLITLVKLIFSNAKNGKLFAIMLP